MRAVALGGDLMVGRAAAAVHARAVRVLVGARGFVAAGPARLASAVSARLRAHVADALHLPGAPVSRLARRTRLADMRAHVVRGRIQRAYDALSVQVRVQSKLRTVHLKFSEVQNNIVIQQL